MKAYARCISMGSCSMFTLLMLFSVAHAQQKAAEKPRPPTKPQTPTVNCSEAQTSKACSSFKQLLDAHDSDMLVTLSPVSYVCFRPIEDAFLVFHTDALSPYGWRPPDDGVGQIQESSANLLEYRDGIQYSAKSARRYWYRYGPDDKPVFHSETTEGRYKGLKIDIDDSELSIDFPFNNQIGGTTQYSLTIRRSTGRFIETYSSENTATTTHSGICLIYR